MSAHRFLFYAPDFDAGADAVDLDGVEHHHLSRVLRLRPGAEIDVTDGRGLVAACRVSDVAAARSRLSVVSRRRVEPPAGLTLALALIRKDRFAQAVEQCIELGVTRVLPFSTSGSRPGRMSTAARERLSRVAVSALKQSGRAWLPEMADAVSFDGLLEAVSACPRVLAGEQGAPAPPRGTTGDAMALVGPEAGFSADERGALERAGVRFVSVSPHRLRSETAAVALVAALTLGD